MSEKYTTQPSLKDIRTLNSETDHQQPILLHQQNNGPQSIAHQTTNIHNLNIHIPQAQPNQTYSNYSRSPRHFNYSCGSASRSRIAPKNLFWETTSNSQLPKSVQEYLFDHQKLNSHEKDKIFDEMINKIIELSSENENHVERRMELEEIVDEYRQRYGRQSNQENENMRQLQIILMQTEKIQNEMKQLKATNLKLEKNLEQSNKIRACLTSELKLNEQVNYELRLKIQELTQELLLRPQLNMTMQQWRQEKQRKIIELEQKMNKMEIMKKQYLKAYSKVKDEKEELQLKLYDLQEEMKERRVDQKPDAMVERLKTIVEIPEEQFRESLNRISKLSDGYPTAHVKSLLQKSLEEQNKLESEKYIKSAIVFLNTHEVHSEDIEQIHSYYKNLLMEVQKSVQRQKKRFQHEFDELLNKLLSNKSLSGEKSKSPDKQHLLNFDKKEVSNFTQAKTQDHETEAMDEKFSFDLQISDQKDIASYCFVNKLKNMKDQYDSLSEQHELLKKRSSGMEKLIGGERSSEQQVLKDIYSEIYQALCQFPVNEDARHLFEPKSLQQLLKCVRILHKFSLKYEETCNSTKEQVKQCIFQLIKILEEVKKRACLSSQQLMEIIKGRKFPILHDMIFLKLNQLMSVSPKNIKTEKALFVEDEFNKKEKRPEKREKSIEKTKNSPKQPDRRYESPIPTKTQEQIKESPPLTPQLLDQLQILKRRMGL